MLIVQINNFFDITRYIGVYTYTFRNELEDINIVNIKYWQQDKRDYQVMLKLTKLPCTPAAKLIAIQLMPL